MFARVLAQCVSSSSSSSAGVVRRTLASSAAAQNALSVGFIGLGNMGAHMARNLKKAGHRVVVHDVAPAAVAKLVESGCVAATSPVHVAREADVVVSMLPSSPHTRRVYLGDDGVLSGVRKGALLIDASTIDPNTARDVTRAAMDKGADMVDAPVSGGVIGAEAATLTFMVGGTEAAFERAKPVLGAMGKNIVHCGPSGAGQVVKICNNLVLGVTMIGLSEAMNLGMQYGMDPQVLQKIFSTSSASCWSNNVYNPAPGALANTPASRDYAGGFGSDLMKKDLGLALDAAAEVKAPLTMASLAYHVYQLMSAHGLGHLDFGAVFKYLQRNQQLVPKAK